MDLIKANAPLTTLLLVLFVSFQSFAGNQNNQLVKGIQLFDTGNYKEAETVFKKLLDEKADHLMINYYYGASRTENGHFGSKEVIYLLKGSTGEAPLKTDYYLGVQYHAQNRWDDALKHYKRFGNKIGQAEQDNVQLSEKIQQCNNKINPFQTAEEETAGDVLPTAVPREKQPESFNPVVSPALMAAADTFETPESTEIQETDKAQTSASEPIDFMVNGEITYLDKTHFRTSEGLAFYNNWNEKQKALTTRQKETEVLRDKYASAESYNEKQKLGQIILEAESEIYSLQTETNQLLMQAKVAENEYWKNAPAEEKSNFLNELDNYIDDMLKAETSEELADSSILITQAVLLPGAESVPQAEELPEDELVYKIQLGAYSRGLPTYMKRLFDKLSYIRKIENYTDEKGIVVYTTGNLTSYEDAVKMQNQVRQEGVEDAFVVPYFNGKRITLKEAKEIEADR